MAGIMEERRGRSKIRIGRLSDNNGLDDLKKKKLGMLSLSDLKRYRRVRQANKEIFSVRHRIPLAPSQYETGFELHVPRKCNSAIELSVTPFSSNCE